MLFETKRLFLRQFQITDCPFIIALLNTEGWLRFISDRNVHNEKQALAYLETGPFQSYRDFGFGLYAVCLQENKTPIGMCGMLKRASLDYPDLGFAFLPEFNGKGYAFEAAEGVLDFERKRHHIPHVAAITLEDNFSSIKLLKKLGFEQKNAFLSDEKEHLIVFEKSML